MSGVNRYSRFIGRARVILPLLALALLSTMFLFARRPDPDAAIPFADADVEALARDQQVGTPRFAGTLEDGTPITLNAVRIAPTPGQPSRFTAVAVEGRISPDDGDDTVLQAETGILDTGAQTLMLRTGVDLARGAVWRLRTEQLNLDLEGRSMVSDAGVAVTGPGLTMTAGHMTAREGPGGAVFTFTRGVNLLYTARQ